MSEKRGRTRRRSAVEGNNGVEGSRLALQHDDLVEAGARLRQARFLSSLTLQDLESLTGVPLEFLKAIEAGELSLLPGPEVTSAYMKTYAEELSLDPATLLPGTVIHRSGVGDPDSTDALYLAHGSADRADADLVAGLGKGAGLRRTVWLAGAALIAALMALVAVTVTHRAAPARRAGATPATIVSPAVATFRLISSGPGQAAYLIPKGGFSVEVSTSRPSWLEVKTDGNTVFAATVAQPQNKWFPAKGSAALQLGAGGSTVRVRAGQRTIGSIQPSSAPFSLSFTSVLP